MKKRPVLHQLALFCIAASVYFFAAPFAQANTFTLPQQISYPGLTFSSPLTYSHPIILQEPTTSISFTSHNELMINKADTKKPLETIVLTPTLGLTETPPQTNLPQPTPTIYMQTAKTETVQSPTPPPTTQPTEQPTPTNPPATYTPVPQTNAGGLNADDLFSMVNAYRASQGLPAFQQDAKTCSLAQVRAPMVAGEVATGTMHSGLRAMNLAYWNTENIISMNSDQAAFNWWLNDPIHHAAIVSNNTYSCVACSGNSCAEEFTSYQPK
ncbi:MAG TPA: CAP domain-containing protein [Candidatus Acidoferrales bacterium]|nr:CAP domain-containing protein [Candidatus Acidoferrales bacterium]